MQFHGTVGGTVGSEPDPAIGIYDENAQPDAKSSNCGGDLGVVVGGAIQLSEEHRFLKAFISSTLGGSPYCAFTGGDWARTNATTIMLTPDPVFHFDPAPITVEGNLLTFPQTNATYTRRS